MLVKRIFVTIFLIFSTNCSFANDEDAILGMWLTESKKAVVEITKKENKFEGKIIWLFRIATGLKTDIFDEKNPEEKLQKRSLQGLKNLDGFSFDDNEWTGGTIYDPNSGKTYSAKMSLKDNKTLKLRGYVGIPLFGKTSTWTRVESLEELPSK